MTLVEWLNTWETIDTASGRLNNDTHKLLRLTSYALVKVPTNCLRELGFSYALLGKFHRLPGSQIGEVQQAC